MDWMLAFLLGYALGSVPFGVILTQLTGAGDLRSIGSGNIGATNVLRTGRKGLAAATLLLDIGKGCSRCCLPGACFPSYPIWRRWAQCLAIASRCGCGSGAARAWRQ